MVTEVGVGSHPREPRDALQAHASAGWNGGHQCAVVPQDRCGGIAVLLDGGGAVLCTLRVVAATVVCRKEWIGVASVPSYSNFAFPTRPPSSGGRCKWSFQVTAFCQVAVTKFVLRATATLARYYMAEQQVWSVYGDGGYS